MNHDYGIDFFNYFLKLFVDYFKQFFLLTFSTIDSVAHPFVGDYVRLRQNVQWKKLCMSLNDQYIVFADVVNKITRSSGKVSKIQRVLPPDM